jgi:hypothetical protein
MGVHISSILHLEDESLLRQVQPSDDLGHHIINLNILGDCDLCRITYHPLSILHLILEHLEVLCVPSLIHLCLVVGLQMCNVFVLSFEFVFVEVC